MTCNPWRWLWGLIPLAMLSWITLHLEQGRIEADLRTRTSAALERAGLGWAATQFSGRDAVLTGKASGAGEPPKAVDVTRRVWGVRIVESRADLIPTLESYIWSAMRDTSGSVVLSGYIPSEPSRRAVVTAARAAFPGADVQDKMELARGAPERDVLIKGIDHSLRKLAQLKTGRVDLNGTALTIEGDAPDLTSYKTIRSQIGVGLPTGITLADARIRGPSVSPYQWTAALAGNQVVLSGYAPDDADREKIFSAAKNRFPRFAIVDRMELGGGAPADFVPMVTSSLDQLAKLQQGSAALSGSSFLLKGRAADQATAAAVREAFGKGISKTISAKAEIDAPKAVAPEPVAVPEAPVPSGPYVTTAAIDNGKIVLTGFAPSDDTRARVAAAFRSAFPDLTIEDKMSVRAGADAVWQSCFEAGLKGLGKLNTGTATLTGSILDFNGSTDDDDVAQSVTSSVRASVPSGCDARVQVKSSGRVQAELRRKAEEDARRAQAEADAKRKAEEEEAKRIAADAEAKRKAEDDARRAAALAAERAAAEAEAKKRAEEEAKKKAEADARLAARRAEAQKCEKLLAGAAAAGTINFKRAEAVLDPKSGPTLDALAKIVNECPGFAVRIEGHTDSEGVPERNQPLSERRAKAVVDYLISAGVSAERLRFFGFGAERPIADNATADGRAKNRRIEFKVVAEE